MEALSDWLNLIADLLIFLASQIFWIRRVFELGRRFVPVKTWRISLTAFMCALYALPVAYIFHIFIFAPAAARLFRASEHSLVGILLVALFWWWFVGSPRVSF